MASNESNDPVKDVKTDLRASLLMSFDDETDSMQLFPQCREAPIIRLDFSRPLKRFDMEVSYDSVQVFYQDLGFSDVTIDRLKPYFSSLENFIHYDVYAIIERLEAYILTDENNADKLSIKSQQEFFQILCLFGFQDAWAQTYTWAMGKAYADRLVKHSIEECIRLRLSSSNTIQPFPEWSSDIAKNQWQTPNNLELEGSQNFFIRNQNRQNLPGFGRNLNDIGFNDLINLTRANHTNPQYWFHATDWSSAENILRSGADRRGDHTDFCKDSAYYLNNDYRDCYEFLSQRNHKFNGRHAILIYEFDPEHLSNGRYICLDTDSHANQRKWQQIVFSCINSTSRNEIGDLNKCDCVFGWQCTNPNEVYVRRANNNTPQRRTRPYDAQYAVQLAIRTKRMLTKVDDHLIGVVIFEHS